MRRSRRLPVGMSIPAVAIAVLFATSGCARQAEPPSEDPFERTSTPEVVELFRRGLRIIVEADEVVEVDNNHADALERLLDDDALYYLRNCRCLRVARLVPSQIRGPGLRYLSGLKSLTEIYLNGAAIGDSDLVHLERLVNMTVLDLSVTNVSDAGLRHLAAFNNLVNLNLRGTKITGRGLVHLAGMTEVWSLDLAYSPLDDQGITFLPPLKRLRDLNLTCTHLTDAALPHLAKYERLERLWLRGTRIDGSRLDELKTLRQLIQLDLRETKASAEAAARLAASLPDVWIVLDGKYVYGPDEAARQAEHKRKSGGRKAGRGGRGGRGRKGGEGGEGGQSRLLTRPARGKGRGRGWRRGHRPRRAVRV